MLTLNLVAAWVILMWASWCILSPKVNDGIVGKMILIGVALSAYAMATDPGCSTHWPSQAEITLHLSLAISGMWHFTRVQLLPSLRDFLHGDR